MDERPGGGREPHPPTHRPLRRHPAPHLPRPAVVPHPRPRGGTAARRQAARPPRTGSVADGAGGERGGVGGPGFGRGARPPRPPFACRTLADHAASSDSVLRDLAPQLIRLAASGLPVPAFLRLLHREKVLTLAEGTSAIFGPMGRFYHFAPLPPPPPPAPVPPPPSPPSPPPSPAAWPRDAW
eukprot:TRINITY_DN4742_c0_g1_i1.p2 TRINITY_DN4742_c0_g1~~TRINITY_DN4742_c0_g1_i1.p2  ORF type:complete len:183 (-),score=15.01 TRINITY_DN4742_c0_g1_i1:299-847(-)